MIPIRSFWATAMAGGAAVTLLLAAGMALTIRGLDAVAEGQVLHLREKEQEITLVERLRWSGEVIISAGRGYLITLMGVVAHDLRNPLGAIQLKAALLRRTADAPETVRLEAESIENITGRMEFLIGSMLDVTTIEAGRFSVTQEICAVADLLREADEMFSNAAVSKGARFLQPAHAVGIRVHADRERVLQVLSNLLGNALKFMPPGGEIGLSMEQCDGMVRFAVSDSGPGISAEHLPNLFDRFWKHEASGKNGTGLGLFIAKGIVEAHGGRIWAASDPGRGATFYFTLPVADPAL